MTWQTHTEHVLSRVLQEREDQVAQYGHNEDLEDGTGPGAPWLMPMSLHRADDIEASFRQEYQAWESIAGKPTWRHLVREEVAEAFMENDPDRLEAELIQVAALCVSWVETLQKRRGDVIPIKPTVDNLGLSVRVKNILQRNGIETVDELCARSWLDLYEFRGFGANGADEIAAALREQGRSLRGESL